MAWESTAGWLNSLGHYTHMGDLEKASVSWLLTGPALAIAAIHGGASKWKMPVSVSPSLCKSTFSIKK